MCLLGRGVVSIVVVRIHNTSHVTLKADGPKEEPGKSDSKEASESDAESKAKDKESAESESKESSESESKESAESEPKEPAEGNDAEGNDKDKGKDKGDDAESDDAPLSMLRVTTLRATSDDAEGNDKDKGKDKSDDAKGNDKGKGRKGKGRKGKGKATKPDDMVFFDARRKGKGRKPDVIVFFDCEETDIDEVDDPWNCPSPARPAEPIEIHESQSPTRLAERSEEKKSTTNAAEQMTLTKDAILKCMESLREDPPDRTYIYV